MLSMPGTMIDYFKARGYRTGYIGNNHVLKPEVLKAMDSVHLRDREPFRKYNQFVPPEWHSDTCLPAEETHAWLNTADALQFIEDPATRTMFTSASYGELSKELIEKNRVAEDPETPLHSLAEETSSDSKKRYSMVRTREWKFLLSESRPPELYRMNDGWIERENVAERPEHAPVRRQMEQQLRAFWRW